MLQLEPGIMIWTWVTFIVLFAVLAKVAWKPILSMVNKREETISDSLKRAENAKTEAQELLEKYEKMMADAQEEIQKMMKDNKEMAENIKNEIISDARAEADKIQKKAHSDIEREKEAAIKELRQEATDLAVRAASQLIKENLDSKKHRELVDNYIKDLEQMN